MIIPVMIARLTPFKRAADLVNLLVQRRKPGIHVVELLSPLCILDITHPLSSFRSPTRWSIDVCQCSSETTRERRSISVTVGVNSPAPSTLHFNATASLLDRPSPIDYFAAAVLVKP